MWWIRRSTCGQAIRVVLSVGLASVCGSADVDFAVIYPTSHEVYTQLVTKRLIDVDDEVLDAGRAQLGTRTIKDTVNEALRQAAQRRDSELASALSVLADADLDDRSAAWR